jgi:malate dehydrogenase (oxaloacetate-decarboxylating)(NADP+)
MESAEAIGPILVGMNKPVHVLQQNSDINDIVNMAAICAMDIQVRRKRAEKERGKAAAAETVNRE